MSDRDRDRGSGKRILVLDEDDWDPMRVQLVSSLVANRVDVERWEMRAADIEKSMSFPHYDPAIATWNTEEWRLKALEYRAESQACVDWSEYLLMRYFGMTKESIAPPSPKEPGAPSA